MTKKTVSCELTSVRLQARLAGAQRGLHATRPGAFGSSEDGSILAYCMCVFTSSVVFGPKT